MKLKKILFTCGFVCLLGVIAFAAEQMLLSVQVKETPLRATPSFLGKVLATVPYTEQVELLKEQSGWFNVRVLKDRAEGWMHTSALTKKKIVLKPTEKDMQKMAADPDAVALAGKGVFGPESEQGYKKKYSHANYAVVDNMEKIVVSQKQIVAFIQQGELAPQGGVE